MTYINGVYILHVSGRKSSVQYHLKEEKVVQSLNSVRKPFGKITRRSYRCVLTFRNISKYIVIYSVLCSDYFTRLRVEGIRCKPLVPLRLVEVPPGLVNPTRVSTTGFLFTLGTFGCMCVCVCVCVCVYIF